MTTPIRLPDRRRSVSSGGLVHRAARLVAALLPDAELQPIRDEIGTIGYQVITNSERLFVCAKRSSGGIWLGINEQLLLEAHSTGSEMVLVVYSGARKPELYRVPIERALVGPRNQASAQRFRHVAVSALRPWGPPAQGEPMLA